MSDLILFRPALFGPVALGCSVGSSFEEPAPTNKDSTIATNSNQANALVINSGSRVPNEQPSCETVTTQHFEADAGRDPTTSTSMEAFRKLADEQPEGIRDMSVNGMSHPVMVSVHDRDYHRQFNISRELLLAKGTDFGLDNLADETVTSITLHDVNTDAFNLFVMWLYGYDLPKVTIPALGFHHPDNSLVTRLDHGKPGSSQSDNLFAELVPKPLTIPMPGPTFTNTLQPRAKGSLVMENLQHICFMEDYERFSVEEIRLANLASASTVSSSSSERGESLSSPPKFSLPQSSRSDEYVSPGSLKRGRLPSELPQTLKKAKTETDLGRGNEKIQTLLLELALLAHKYGWPQCFNMAVDTYRLGEREMKRKLPKLDHIRLAYKNHATMNTPVALLMADYSFYKGTQAGLTEFAHTVFLERPLFMQDYVARFDGKVEVPGCKVFCGDDTGIRISTNPTGIEASSSSWCTPLDDLTADHYHMKY